MICLLLLAAAADTAGYDKTVAPFLAAYCVKCHAGDKPRGGFSVERAKLPPDLADAAARARWREVVNVLNSHEMPPKKEKQPPAATVAAVADWITAEAVRVELARREGGAVLRRLNRAEYRNTIRDLVGVDFDVSGFPQDPPASGFDNNGSALTLSPLHVEIYLKAAGEILDRALVEGERPKAIKWRFEPKAGPADRTRKRLDAKNNPIVNGGNNRQDGEWVVVHHDSWDRHVGARDFHVPVAGTYRVRLYAAGRVPGRKEVVESAERILAARRDEQDKRDPKRAKWHDQQYKADLEHFRTARMYDYGPPRVKFVLQLGPQPRTVAEFDAGGTEEKPTTHEFDVRFTTESAGVSFDYAYAIPRVLENFWMQGRDTFARPELMIKWFEIEGPVYDAWPPASHSRILFDSPLAAKDERAYARAVLERFMGRAYRRPVTKGEVDARLKLFDRWREGRSFVETIKRPLLATLASPHFLYLVEPEKKLGEHALAARLSYFLWSAPPDDELTRLAGEGKLRAGLAKQVGRMIADPRSEALAENFAGQWLGLREVGTNPPAANLYPEYDRHLETSSVAESRAFFDTILREDLPATAFVKSGFVTINERLARFYSIDGVRGDHMRKVEVPAGVRRGGVVTQASVLAVTSNGTRTSPVKRGTWVMKNLLGSDPGLPVANAGEVPPKVPGIGKATVRVRLEAHRALEQCARCHAKIDPLGFALENYDAAGMWREQEGFGYNGRVGRDDPKIDAASAMPDGTRIVGVEGLQKAILAREDQFLDCLARKLATYALGRELGLADRPLIQGAVRHMKANKGTLRSLIVYLVTAEAFGVK